MADAQAPGPEPAPPGGTPPVRAKRVFPTKMAAGGLIFVSLFYLVLVDKMTPEQYLALATAALAALGGHGAATAAKGKDVP